MLQQQESSQPSTILPVILPQYIDDAEQSYLNASFLPSDLRQTFLYVGKLVVVEIISLAELQHRPVFPGPVRLLSLEAESGLEFLQRRLLVLARAGPASTRPS